MKACVDEFSQYMPLLSYILFINTTPLFFVMQIIYEFTKEKGSSCHMQSLLYMGKNCIIYY